jgi:hypothetical protein
VLISDSLHENLSVLDFNLLLPDVVMICGRGKNAADPTMEGFPDETA